MSFKNILATVVTGLTLWHHGFALAATPPLPVSKPTVSTSSIPTIPAPTPSPTPSPSPLQNTFNPKVTIKTLANKNDTTKTSTFYNGVFVNEPSGAVEQVCGTVTNANDLQLDNRSRAYINIDGKPFPLDYIGVGSYKFCGDVNIKKQEVDMYGVRKNMTDVFNDFVITLVSKTGGAYKDRYTIVNSPSRATADNTHKNPLDLLLDNTGEEGERMNEYLTHAINDFILSNEDTWTDKMVTSFNNTFSSCNMEYMYNDATDNEDSFWAWIFMEVFGGLYGITHDLDANEIMFLCPQSVTIGDSDLSAKVGQSADEMFTVDGKIIDVEIRFSFVHRFNSSMIYGNKAMEEGTLVIHLGAVDLSGSVADLDVDEGNFTGNITIDETSISEIDAYWEDWKSYNYFGETSDSGMDEADDIIDDEMADGLTAEDKEIEIDNELNNDDMSLSFVPAYIYSNLFAIMVDELTVDTVTVNNDFSSQKRYVASTNNGFFEIYNNKEMGFAFDDDMINQILHLQTKQGQLNIAVSETLPDGTIVSLTMNEAIAPVLSFNGEEDYALRLDVNNAALVISSNKNSYQAEYRLDAAAKLDAIGNPNGVDLKVVSTNVNIVEIKSIKAPDKVVVDKLISKAISSLVNSKIEPLLNDTILGAIEAITESGDMDICTDLYLDEMNGSNNYLTGAVDLDYDDTISRTDTCFKLPVKTQTTTGGGTGYEACKQNPDLCNE